MSNPQRILVVDDSLTIRRALEFILKPQGYQVEFAADGRESIAKAAEFDPHLVLLDYVLPDMRGPDICAALASMPVTAHTPVILVSAKGASVRQAYQDAQNVVSYITKPFKPQVVTAIVANALARSGAAPAQPSAAKPDPMAGKALPPRPEALAATTRPNVKLLAGSTDETFTSLLGQLEETLTGYVGVEPRRLGAVLRGLVDRMGDIDHHLRGESLVPYRLRDDGSFANIAATLLDAHRALCATALTLASSLPREIGLPSTPRIVAACPPDHPLHAALSDEVASSTGRILVLESGFTQLPFLVRLLAPGWVLVASSAMAEIRESARSVFAGSPDSSPKLIALDAPGAPAPDDGAASYFKRIDDPGDLKDMLRALLLETAPPEAPTSAGDLEVVTLGS
jgi:CheY-like chemotaxis protein